MFVCVCVILSAMRRNGNKKKNNNSDDKRSKNKGSPNMSAMPAFAFMADTPIYKKDLQFLRLKKQNK